MALIRTYPRCLGDAFMATSKSANDTFSRLGMFSGRAMPRVDHNLHPNARKIIGQSDKTFGNCYIFFNGLISYTIYGIVSGLLCFILIGFPLLAAVFVLAIWGPIRAALAARDGEFREYPLVIKFFKNG